MSVNVIGIYPCVCGIYRLRYFSMKPLLHDWDFFHSLLSEMLTWTLLHTFNASAIFNSTNKFAEVSYPFFSEPHSFAASSSYDNTVKLWNAETAQIVSELSVSCNSTAWNAGRCIQAGTPAREIFTLDRPPSHPGCWVFALSVIRSQC